MKRSARMLLLILPLLLLQAGCWDIKSIHDTNYITAIGMDYKDGHYIVYAQMLDFFSVAKQQSGKSNQPAQVWTGHAAGNTVAQAFNRLYETSQQRVLWSHVSAIVMTEEALKQGIYPFIDGTIRFGETRYTQWIYGTKQPIDRLFSVTPFFNLSPLSSILHYPPDNYRQRSYIRPMRLFKALARLREPGFTLLLPSLSISKDTWMKDEQADPKLKVDGVFVVQDNKLLTWIQKDELDGLRWLEKDTVRTPAVVEKDGKPAIVLSLKAIKAKIVPQVDGDTASYSIHVRCKAQIEEVLEPMDEASIRIGAARRISDEIKYTAAYGKKNTADLFSLEHSLYWDKFPDWSRLTKNGSKPLQDYSLKSVTVDVQLVSSGMNKLLQFVKDY